MAAPLDLAINDASLRACQPVSRSPFSLVIGDIFGEGIIRQFDLFDGWQTTVEAVFGQFAETGNGGPTKV